MLIWLKNQNKVRYRTFQLRYNPGGPQAKALAIKSKRQEYQFFDSTAERFPRGTLRDEEEREKPGPGQYTLMPIDIRVPDFKKMKDERFADHGERPRAERSCTAKRPRTGRVQGGRKVPEREPLPHGSTHVGHHFFVFYN